MTLAYLDRETTSAEDFHAGMNFAGVFRVPAIFVCINGAADAGSVETVSETIAVKALAYGLAGVRVDGNDLFAVFSATQAAAARARSGGGATLIEAALATKDDPLDRLPAGSRARRCSTLRARSPFAARSTPKWPLPRSRSRPSTLGGASRDRMPEQETGGRSQCGRNSTRRGGYDEDAARPFLAGVTVMICFTGVAVAQEPPEGEAPPQGEYPPAG